MMRQYVNVFCVFAFVFVLHCRNHVWFSQSSPGLPDVSSCAGCLTAVLWSVVNSTHQLVVALLPLEMNDTLNQ